MADIAALIEQMKSQKARRDVDNGVVSIPNGVESVPLPDKPIQLAILGRQNVGKSTLVNKLVKSERVLSGPIPGLTRDAIAVDYDWDGKKVQLVRHVFFSACQDASKVESTFVCSGRHCRN